MARYTTKDYVLVADTLRVSYDAARDAAGVGGLQGYGGISHCAELLAQATANFAYTFGHDNPRFSTERFIGAVCGSNGALRHLTAQVLDALKERD